MSISESVNQQSLKHNANSQRPSASLWCTCELSVAFFTHERSCTAVHNLPPVVAMLRRSLRRDVFSCNFRFAEMAVTERGRWWRGFPHVTGNLAHCQVNQNHSKIANKNHPKTVLQYITKSPLSAYYLSRALLACALKNSRLHSESI